MKALVFIVAIQLAIPVHFGRGLNARYPGWNSPKTKPFASVTYEDPLAYKILGAQGLLRVDAIAYPSYRQLTK